MSDLLIRDVPEDVLRNVDERARQLGVSRQELLRRRLIAEFSAPSQATTAADLQRASSTFADILDEEVMTSAWR